MKHLHQISTTMLLFALALSTSAMAQDSTTYAKLPTIAIIDADISIESPSKQEFISLLEAKLSQLHEYMVLDHYEISYRLQEKKLEVDNCYAPTCLRKVAEKLGIEYVLFSSFNILGNRYITSLKLIDVASGNTIAFQSHDFAILRGQELNMMQFLFNNMFGITNDANMVEKIMQPSIEDQMSEELEEIPAVNLSGPRTGFAYFGGMMGKMLKSPKSKGGFNASPILSQWGYQFETKYVNSGRFQALFEFVPMLTGLEYGKFAPSFTFLNGFRDNKSGWEFAFGPSLSFVRASKGFYYDLHGNGTKDYVRESEMYNYQADGIIPMQYEPDYVVRPDSRSWKVAYNGGLLVAVGKTIQSGKMNIPVNLYLLTSQFGLRYGLSIGWNYKRKKSSNSDN
ncbi:hypothetical protein GC194_10575 [bacterium]|nr:hypothetical protein [bacterium]